MYLCPRVCFDLWEFELCVVRVHLPDLLPCWGPQNLDKVRRFITKLLISWIPKVTKAGLYVQRLITFLNTCFYFWVKSWTGQNCHFNVATCVNSPSTVWSTLTVPWWSLLADPHHCRQGRWADPAAVRPAHNRPTKCRCWMYSRWHQRWAQGRDSTASRYRTHLAPPELAA